MSQLFMRKDDLTNLPKITLPEGFTLITHKMGMEDAWEKLMEESFDCKCSFEDTLTNWKGFAPEHVFYIEKEGKVVSSASAVENDAFPGEGWIHMVGTHPDARGHGLGKLVTVAALASFAKRGFSSAVLSTDDPRIPAIATYLKLGFKPFILDDTHEERWARVMEQIKR